MTMTLTPLTIPSARSRGPRRGLSIVEVMISLTISSFLLVAVAAAYNASANAVEMNDRFFRATQAGRVTMNQMLTEIRRADWVACAPTHDSIIITRPTQSRLADEDSREFKYDSATKKITLQIYYKNGAGTKWTSPAYSLASNVDSAKFGPPDQMKDATGAMLDVRVPVTVDVKIGSNNVRLSGSSGPRRLMQS
jgi:Tfp pilus assembly protein PilW